MSGSLHWNSGPPESERNISHNNNIPFYDLMFTQQSHDLFSKFIISWTRVVSECEPQYSSRYIGIKISKYVSIYQDKLHFCCMKLSTSS